MQCTSTNDTLVSRYSNPCFFSQTDGVSESVLFSQKHAVGDNKSRMCPPVLAHRCCQKKLTSDLETVSGCSSTNDVKSNGSVTTIQPVSNSRNTLSATTLLDKNETIAHDANNHAMNTACMCTQNTVPLHSSVW